MMRIFNIGSSRQTQQSGSSTQSAHEVLSAAQMQASGLFQRQVRLVSAQTLQSMDLAAQTQQEVRVQLGHGGNQWLPLVADKGESAMRGIMSIRASERFGNEVRERFAQRFSQDASDLDDTYASGHTALRVQGGHCQKFSDLAYTHLAAKGVNKPVMNAIYNNDHVLVLIGDKRQEDPVLLDAWQHLPIVTTLDNSKLDPGRLDVIQQRNDARPDPHAQWALRHVRTMNQNEIEHILTATTYPPVGKKFVKHMVERQRGQEPGRYDVRSLAKDPSTHYTDDSALTGRAFDTMSASSLSSARRAIEKYERAAAADPDGYGKAKRI
ncbi:hypothetical protein SD961_21515 [Erwinia sp. MMLR14_017]|uniref:hypothetical protein n=1 Tax=Erwinia sp. MMLR14_017 TaxID=3093842 RepID=UPI00298FA3BA|nr:hypothetical protein [Erwinia sp. MMLR14_017]MDW8848431.1 hypothetical protein [Erwinia sp. MMLR14_017]